MKVIDKITVPQVKVEQFSYKSVNIKYDPLFRKEIVFKMSPATLYTLDASPPCRAVYMVAKELGVELKHQIVDVVKREQFNPDYIKINPKHTIPTLIDEDLTLTDSHAITTYLVGKFAKNDDLYPKDVKNKALVDQMLHFDSNIMFVALADITRSLILEPQNGITETGILNAKNAYGFLDKYLENKEWVAIDRPTIADFHLVTTVTTLDIFVPYVENENIEKWVERCKGLSCYGETTKGHQDVVNGFTPLLKK